MVFSGYLNKGMLSNSTSTIMMYFTNLTLTNLTMLNQGNLIYLAPFVSQDNTQIIFNNSQITNNTFTAGGNLLYAVQN